MSPARQLAALRVVLRTVRKDPLPILIGGAVLLAVSVFWAKAWNWTMDDAFIGFRCVRNFWNGHGLVFNPGERIEGITNLGWILALLPVSRFVDPVVASKWLAGGFLVLTMVGMIWVGHRVWGRVTLIKTGVPAWLVYGPPVLLALLQLELMFFSASGMETALYAFVLVFISALLVERRALIVVGLMSGFLYALHPEAILIWPAAQLVLVASCGRLALREMRGANVAFSATVAGITAWRLVYYGALLPNTASAKSTSLRAFIGHTYGVLVGSGTTVPPMLAGLTTILLVGVGVVVISRGASVAAAFIAASYGVGLFFAAYAGEDWTGLGRYFAPFVPLTLVALWWGFVSLLVLLWSAHGWSRIAMMRIAVGVVLVMMTVFGTRAFKRLTEGQLASYPGYVMTSKPLVEPALWIRDHVPPGAVIATRRIGAVGYYSDHPIFDWKWGLTDRDVAQWPHEVTTPMLIDDSAYQELWQRRGPDFMLEDRGIVEQLCALGAGSPESFGAGGFRYRVMRRFSLGGSEEWWLCERDEEPLVANGDAPDRPGPGI